VKAAAVESEAAHNCLEVIELLLVDPVFHVLLAHRYVGTHRQAPIFRQRYVPSEHAPLSALNFLMAQHLTERSAIRHALPRTH
jgi:hypothetical protein